MGATNPDGTLHRHIGPVQATALNVTMIVGAGIFITIPPLLDKVPGPYALLAWLLGGVLILLDGLLWSELGAALPGSGGSARYLLECYGSRRWGRLVSFLFIWQFLLSGPLELGSGLIALDLFSTSLHPAWKQYNLDHTLRVDLWQAQDLALTFSPGRFLAFGVGLLLLFLLYRRIALLGRLNLVFSLAVLGLLGWVCVAGALHFDPATFLDFSGAASHPPNLALALGSALPLALYSYLGYYHVCYLGDEVRDPGRTIPIAVLGSALLVVVLFCAAHLAFLGTISWQVADSKSLESDSLPARFFGRVHGEWAVVLVTLLLLGTCAASTFSGLLGYSRIPYGAAQQGLFFPVFARVHPTLHIPHVSLLLVGGLTLVWSFFDLQKVIDVLITTRIIEQFLAQALGVVLLRWSQPNLPRPFRIWLYPVPVLLAALGWGYVYLTSDLLCIALGLLTLLAGVLTFLAWTWRTGDWPFGRA